MSAKQKLPKEGEVWAPNRGAVVIVLKIGNHYELATIHLKHGGEEMSKAGLKNYLLDGGFTKLGNINAK